MTKKIIYFFVGVVCSDLYYKFIFFVDKVVIVILVVGVSKLFWVVFMK